MISVTSAEGSTRKISDDGFTQQISEGPAGPEDRKISDGFSRIVSAFSNASGLSETWTREVTGESRMCSRNGGWSRQISESGRKLTQEEVDFHKEKIDIARDALQKLMPGDFDKIEDGLSPPTAEVPDSHYKRRLLANEVLAATEDYMWNVLDSKVLGSGTAKGVKRAPVGVTGVAGLGRAKSCMALGYLGKEARVHPAVSKALEQAISERFGKVEPGFVRLVTPIIDEDADGSFAEGFRQTISAPGGLARSRSQSRGVLARTVSRLSSSFSDASLLASNRDDSAGRDESLFDEDPTLTSLHKPMRNAMRLHDEVNQLLKTDGIELGRLMPPSHEKPVLKDPMGIQCVAHLHDPKWTKLARAIRESIYDPDFYDDGTYGPMYVRLAIHGAATWDQHDKTGGLEGAAMRFKPEYSDAHNRFCKEVVKRQHAVMKVPFPWASYADIQCLASYVALECANGPVIPFAPGRRDVAEAKDHDGGNDFVLLNYRERGDIGCEDEPAKEKCPASGKTGECPFLRKMKVMPGRLPGPEEGFLGKPCEPVTKENERKEMAEVAHKIREIFVDRIGASEQWTVALIAGGHSLGRCHPQISGYAGPWQSNPGYFNNVYCKKLLSEDWKLVDRNMEDCSGDMITGLKPYGMRRQYVNKGGKGDLMMLVSDMALREDPYFGHWIQEYALDNEKLKTDFGIAFKWITELGFEPPKEKTGLAKCLFGWRKWRADTLKWIGNNVCTGGSGDGGEGGPGVVMAADAPKVGDPYTMEEIKLHASKSDCWVAINGKVCDLTDFMARHPGGVGPILGMAGKDATSEWNAIHSKDVIEKICPDVVIGYVVASKDGGAGADAGPLLGA